MIKKHLILGTIGGLIYVLLELIWRGYSHWTMFLLGGTCFVLLGLINEILDWDTPLTLQMLIGCTVITVLEFITGCVVNLLLGWNVWDYSDLKFNILGQISLFSSIGWYFISLVGITLDDWLRYRLFGEKKPSYKLF